jgi:hypothetical protein
VSRAEVAWGSGPSLFTICTAGGTAGARPLATATWVSRAGGGLGQLKQRRQGPRRLRYSSAKRARTVPGSSARQGGTGCVGHASPARGAPSSSCAEGAGTRRPGDRFGYRRIPRTGPRIHGVLVGPGRVQRVQTCSQPGQEGPSASAIRIVKLLDLEDFPGFPVSLIVLATPSRASAPASCRSERCAWSAAIPG